LSVSGGGAGQTFRIETKTDLKAPFWQTIATNQFGINGAGQLRCAFRQVRKAIGNSQPGIPTFLRSAARFRSIERPVTKWAWISGYPVIHYVSCFLRQHP